MKTTKSSAFNDWEGKMRRVGRHLTGSVILATGLIGVSEARPPKDPFASARVATEGAKVGYHLSAEIRVREVDIPNGCNFVLAHYAYEGQLPPGITFHKWNTLDGSDSLAPFTGTPRQPGTWRGVLEEGLQCTTGSDLNLYRKRIQVTFVIEP
jgi:hypothetical protein